MQAPGTDIDRVKNRKQETAEPIPLLSECGVFAASLPDEFSNVALGTTVIVTYVDAFGDSSGLLDVTKTTSSTAVAVLDAGLLQFNPLTYSVEENDGNIMVTVEHTNGTTGDVTAEYQTVSGTAIGSVDFVPDTGTLMFLGTLYAVDSQIITVVLLNDAVVEGDKDFTIVLSGATNGATIFDGTDTATVTITDSDIESPPGSSSSGCSRTYNPDGSVDPLLPVLVFASLIYPGWRSRKSDV